MAHHEMSERGELRFRLSSARMALGIYGQSLLLRGMSGKMPTFTDQCGERTWCQLVGCLRGRPKSHLDNKVSTLRGFERISATLEAPLVLLTRDTLGRMRLKLLSVAH